MLTAACRYFLRGSSLGSRYITSNGPVPLICTTVSPVGRKRPVHELYRQFLISRSCVSLQAARSVSAVVPALGLRQLSCGRYRICTIARASQAQSASFPPLNDAVVCGSLEAASETASQGALAQCQGLGLALGIPGYVDVPQKADPKGVDLAGQGRRGGWWLARWRRAAELRLLQTGSLAPPGSHGRRRCSKSRTCTSSS